MKKYSIMAVLISALMVTGCSKNSSDSSSEKQSHTKASLITKENETTTKVKTTQVPTTEPTPTTEPIVIDEASLKSSFDKAVYGAFFKIFDSERERKYQVCDADNDGNLEIAVRAVVGDISAPSHLLIQNDNGLNLFFAPGKYGGGTNQEYLYDNNNQSVIWAAYGTGMSGWHTTYYTFENNKWTLKARKKGYTEADGPHIEECIIDGKAAEVSEFDNYGDSLSDIDNTIDISNIIAYAPLKETVDAFTDYLQNNYSVNVVDVYGDGSEYLITASDMFSSYSILPFYEEQNLQDDIDELDKQLNAAKTTCFILDEAGEGTRIRYQIFDKDVIFSNDGDGIAAQIDKFPYEVAVSSEDNSLDNDIISLKELRNGLTKEEAGDISNIKVNFKAQAIAHDGLVLREGPSTSTKQLELIPFGSEVNIVSLIDNYAYSYSDEAMVKVEYNGRKGYACSRYLLIDNSIDLTGFNNKERFVYFSLLYTQANILNFKFNFSGGIFDWTYSDEYFQAYKKMLPAGLTISQLTEDYYKYFSKDFTNYGSKIDVNFNGVYMEKDGYLWLSSAVGGDPYWIKDEIIELIDCSDSAAKLKVVRYNDVTLYPNGIPEEEHEFLLSFEDGRWKVTLLDSIF